MRSVPDRRGALARLAGAALIVVGAARPAWAQTRFDLVQLMRVLGRTKAGEATFTETRSVAVLEPHTLVSSGRLSFEAPDTFVRETLKPRHERVEVVGNDVTMSLGDRTRTVTLDSVPEAAVIFEAIRGTLTGNREAIERHFDATVGGDAANWTLTLKPLEPRLRERVISVRLAGRQAQVREVRIAMADGDHSVMTIEPAHAVAKPASAAN